MEKNTNTHPRNKRKLLIQMGRRHLSTRTQCIYLDTTITNLNGALTTIMSMLYNIIT